MYRSESGELLTQRIPSHGPTKCNNTHQMKMRVGVWEGGVGHLEERPTAFRLSGEGTGAPLTPRGPVVGVEQRAVGGELPAPLLQKPHDGPAAPVHQRGGRARS